MKAIFHVPSVHYPLAKSLGFTSVEVSYTAWPGPDFNKMADAILTAREAGLGVVVNPGFDAGVDHMTVYEFLRKADLGEGDMVMLSDEPNLKGIPPKTIENWDSLCQTIPQLFLVRTMIVLAWIRSYRGYENTCDVLAFDYYKKFTDVFSLAKFVAKFLWTGALHTGNVMGVPAIRYGPAHIKRQVKFWKLLGVRDLAWYSWSVNEENPPWFEKPVDQLPLIQEALKHG